MVDWYKNKVRDYLRVTGCSHLVHLLLILQEQEVQGLVLLVDVVDTMDRVHRDNRGDLLDRVRMVDRDLDLKVDRKERGRWRRAVSTSSTQKEKTSQPWQ